MEIRLDGGFLSSILRAQGTVHRDEEKSSKGRRLFGRVG